MKRSKKLSEIVKIKENPKQKTKKEVNNLIVEVFNGIGLLFLGGFATLGVFIYFTLPTQIFFNVILSFGVVFLLISFLFVKIV